MNAPIEASPGIIVHAVRLQSQPHAIYISAGDRDVFASYALDNLAQNFDILIFFYGTSQEKRERFGRDAKLFAAGAGTKFRALKDIFSQQRERLLQYKTIWVADDDLRIEHGDPRALPAAAMALNIKVLSPAHSRRGKISHPIMLPWLGRHLLRYTNFVEMTCPLFETSELERFLRFFDAVPGGWADDWWFLNFLEADKKAVVGVLDAVTMINPHDREKPGGTSEIEKVGKIATLRDIWHAEMKRHGLRMWTHRNLFFVRPDPEGLAAASIAASLFRRTFRDQLDTFLTELNYQLRFYKLRKTIAAGLRGSR